MMITCPPASVTGKLVEIVAGARPPRGHRHRRPRRCRRGADSCFLGAAAYFPPHECVEHEDDLAVR